jgi:hypothetical protein
VITEERSQQFRKHRTFWFGWSSRFVRSQPVRKGEIGTAVAGIYLIEKNGNLVELRERSYDSEARLQELLARYPSLLAGDQMEAAEPRRWVLVAREMGLLSEEDGSDRWSVDHLFLDQDGVPTIVEVKRSSDSRIRREVIGQMLDYAANGVRYWPWPAPRCSSGHK